MTVTQAETRPRPHRQDRRTLARRVHLGLACLLLLTCALSLETGASGVSLWSVVNETAPDTSFQTIILWEVRLPRVLLGVLVGAALAVSGTVMQGLFRNPLADPGIVGVSAGAGLGAVTAIVLGGLLPIALRESLGPFLVSAAAFLGGWASVLLLYGVATRGGRTSVATMLLAGIALGALAGAVSGLLVYAADDQQLRDLTFWGLGSLAGATWAKVATATPILLVAMAGALCLGRGLNGLAFGEATALHLGIPVQRTKTLAILAVAAATGGAVAVSGGIGFVGIVVPHLLRLATGPDHGPLLINAALLGASLLLGADMISRVIIAPAELPIGIVTAVLGAPVFLWILLRQRPTGDF